MMSMSETRRSAIYGSGDMISGKTADTQKARRTAPYASSRRGMSCGMISTAIDIHIYSEIIAVSGSDVTMAPS